MRYLGTVGFLLFFSLVLQGCSTASKSPYANDEMDSEIFDVLRCWQIKDQLSPDDEQVDYVRQKAADGNQRCKVLLGVMYMLGRGVPQDYAKTREIFNQVGDADPKNYILLASMLEKGQGGPIDYASARELYERAYRSGSSEGAVKYAEFLADGKGGEQDENRAMSILFDNTKNDRDSAWNMIRVLRGRGVLLSPEQIKKYNQIWREGLGRSIDNAVFVLNRKGLKIAPEPTSSANVIHLNLLFEPNVNNPVVTIREPSRDPVQDSMALDTFMQIRMKDSYLSPSGQASRVTQNVELVVEPRFANEISE